MRKVLSKISKTSAVIIGATILVTLGISASDGVGGLSRPLLGSLVMNIAKNDCPDGMVYVTAESGGFCVDTFEAAAGENCPNKIPGNQGESRANLESSGCAPVSERDMTPWTNISLNQAEEACRRAGKRLPSNKEWFAAALGTPDRNMDWGRGDCQVRSNWDSQPGKTGSGENCVSSAGAYDMIGNVWEWANDIAIDNVYDGRALPKDGYVTEVDKGGVPTKTDAVKPDDNFNQDYFNIYSNGARGFLRGGYWNNESGAGKFAVNLLFSPSNVGIGVGFRCVK